MQNLFTTLTLVSAISVPLIDLSQTGVDPKDGLNANITKSHEHAKVVKKVVPITNPVVDFD